MAFSFQCELPKYILKQPDANGNNDATSATNNNVVVNSQQCHQIWLHDFIKTLPIFRIEKFWDEAAQHQTSSNYRYQRPQKQDPNQLFGQLR